MSKLNSVAIAFVVLSWLPVNPVCAQQPPLFSQGFEFGTPNLAKRGDAYVLVHTVTSTSTKNRLWALVEVNNADGSRKCEWLKTLEPEQAYRFECPLEGAAVEQKYDARLRVYSDRKLLNRKVLWEPVFYVTPRGLAAAAEPGAASAEGSIVVPDGVFEGTESALPATFKPTWYRRVDRGFALRAYENSGDLTVTADELVFVADEKTVRIPYPRILSVRWEPLPNDIANHWVVVRFTNDEDKPHGVAFRDGGRMGRRQGTGMIYQAVRRAARK